MIERYIFGFKKHSLNLPSITWLCLFLQQDNIDVCEPPPQKNTMFGNWQGATEA